MSDYLAHFHCKLVLVKMPPDSSAQQRERHQDKQDSEHSFDRFKCNPEHDDSANAKYPSGNMTGRNFFEDFVKVHLD